MKNSLNTAKSVRLALGAATALALLTASTAGHAVIMYNQDVLDPPGVHFGSGNVNGFWAIDIGGGVELALRAALRQQGPSASTSGGTYGIFPTGTQTDPTPNPARATWNYEWSINVRADADPDRTFATSGLTFELCADLDNSGGVTYECVNPLTNWGDNSIVDDYSAQNSQQLLFGDSPGNSTYDIDAHGLYDFRLTAYDGQDVVAQTEISVRVPEPVSLAVFGIGLLGLGAARRRRSV